MHLIGGNGVTPRVARSRSERLNGAAGADLRTIEKSLVAIVDLSKVEGEALSFPVRRYADKAAIPGEAVMGLKISSELFFPEARDAEAIPREGLGSTRRECGDSDQGEEKSG